MMALLAVVINVIPNFYRLNRCLAAATHAQPEKQFTSDCIMCVCVCVLLIPISNTYNKCFASVKGQCVGIANTCFQSLMTE